ncbi:endonuclease NucS [Deinococcus roseus]|uniref:endonuclease NucS n=1 Tax=Deinococcus roseus TaxID=392414 RepID=UPI0016697676|nr:endonuclease NucS [Deinococcus roseus]
MIAGLLHQPSCPDLLAFLSSHLNSGRLVQLVGECEISYAGRAASHAEAGNYLVIVKPDGSIQVQGAKGVKPVNWQPRTDHISVSLEAGMVVLTAERNSPPEVVRVVCLDPHLAFAAEFSQEYGFVLSGSEAEMRRTLKQKPDAMEMGLKILEEELLTDVGGVDLFARDREGQLVVIELKRARATHEAVFQLDRYVKLTREQTGQQVRGLLVAPSITFSALERLQGLGLEFCEMTVLPVLEEDRQLSLFDF